MAPEPAHHGMVGLPAAFAGVERAGRTRRSDGGSRDSSCAARSLAANNNRSTSGPRGAAPHEERADMATTEATFDIAGRIGKITQNGKAVKSSLGADAFQRGTNGEKATITL